MEEKQYHSLRAVEDGHWWFRSLNELAVSCVREALDSRSARVLDAGCGTGGLLARLAPLAQAEGIDVSRLAVELAAARGVGAVRRADLNDPGLEPGRYDAIASVDVLYHRDVRDDAAVVRRLAEALRPGGLLFLHLPAYRWLRSRHDDRVQGVRRYTLPEARRLVGDAGLDVVHGSYRCAALLPPIALWRAATKRLRPRSSDGGGAASDVGSVPALLNLPLLWLCRLENRLGRRWALPFGSSVWVLGRKRES